MWMTLALVSYFEVEQSFEGVSAITAELELALVWFWFGVMLISASTGQFASEAVTSLPIPPCLLGYAPLTWHPDVHSKLIAARCCQHPPPTAMIREYLSHPSSTFGFRWTLHPKVHEAHESCASRSP